MSLLSGGWKSIRRFDSKIPLLRLLSLCWCKERRVLDSREFDVSRVVGEADGRVADLTTGLDLT